jgi:hypothetical protein
MSGVASHRSIPNQLPPPEPADHRIDHEEHVVPAAYLGDSLDVTVGRREHSASADHRLDKERRDSFRAERPDGFFKRSDRVPRHAMILEWAEASAVGFDAAEDRAKAVGPVVAGSA